MAIDRDRDTYTTLPTQYVYGPGALPQDNDDWWTGSGWGPIWGDPNRAGDGTRGGGGDGGDPLNNLPPEEDRPPLVIVIPTDDIPEPKVPDDPLPEVVVTAPKDDLPKSNPTLPLLAGSIPFLSAGGAVPKPAPARRPVPRRTAPKPAPRRRFTPAKPTIPRSVPGIKAQPGVLARIAQNPFVKALMENLPKLGKVVGGGARIITNPLLMAFGWTDIGEEPNVFRPRPQPEIDRSKDTYTTLPEQEIWGPTTSPSPSAYRSPLPQVMPAPYNWYTPGNDLPGSFGEPSIEPSTTPTSLPKSPPVPHPEGSVSPLPLLSPSIDPLLDLLIPTPAPSRPSTPRNAEPERRPEPGQDPGELALPMPSTAADPCAANKPKKEKKKERKARQTCYRGTYIETSKSTRKSPKEKIKCQ